MEVIFEYFGCAVRNIASHWDANGTPQLEFVFKRAIWLLHRLCIYIRLEPRIKFSFVCTLSLTAKNISTDNFKECSEGRHRKIESFYLLNSAMYQDSDTKMKIHLKLLINLLHQLHSVSFIRDIISVCVKLLTKVCLLEMFHNLAIPFRKIWMYFNM